MPLTIIMRTYQDRLAMVHDNIKRKVADLQISHTGSAIDCIRMTLKKNDEGDITSRIIEKADVVSIIFPPLKDVPYRRLSKDPKGRLQLTSLVDAFSDEAKANYVIVAPHNDILMPDDLLIRIMQDHDTPDRPIILCLQVVESLGTFGGSMIIMSKYNTVLYNETLDENTLQIIVEMAKRRLHLKY